MSSAWAFLIPTVPASVAAYYAARAFYRQHGVEWAIEPDPILYRLRNVGGATAKDVHVDSSRLIMAAKVEGRHERVAPKAAVVIGLPHTPSTYIHHGPLVITWREGCWPFSARVRRFESHVG